MTTFLTSADRCAAEAVAPDLALWERVRIKSADRHHVRDGLPLLQLGRDYSGRNSRAASRCTHQTERSRETRCVSERTHHDPLKAIDAEIYLEILAPESEPSRGRCRCPLPNHEDRNPSASYTGTVWYCHRCATGGDIYTLGSQLLGLAERGEDFLELRRELAGRMLGAAA